MELVVDEEKYIWVIDWAGLWVMSRQVMKILKEILIQLNRIWSF